MAGRRAVRLALLGCGGHAKLHHAGPMAHYAAEHPDELELAAACDLDKARAQQVAAKFGFGEAYTDMDRMLAEVAPDAVVCVMAIPNVSEMAMELLRRGVRCTIEKPLGTSIQQVRDLAEVARQTRTPHMVSVNRRFWPHLQAAREWISERSPLRLIRATMLRNGRAEPDFVWGTGIHAIDALVSIAGPIADYEASIFAGDELTAKWYDVSLKFASGCRGEVHILPTCGRNEEIYEMFGEGFCIRVSMDAVSMDGEEVFTFQRWQDSRLVQEDRIADPDHPWLGNGGYGEVRALVEALREGRPLGPTVEDVLPAMELCFELSERFS